MADDIKADELVEQLRDTYALSIRTAEPGIPAGAAMQLADLLVAVQLDVMAGKRVTYRGRQSVDGEAIAEDWRCGQPLQEIMRKHGCSRSVAYKYHPSRTQRVA